VGDDKYGDDATRAWFKEKGLNRMFLHAKSLSFDHPITEQPLSLEAALPESFVQAQAIVQSQGDREALS
jgi:23S rRNA pseudouridine955/2504/2580 synthase